MLSPRLHGDYGGTIVKCKILVTLQNFPATVLSEMACLRQLPRLGGQFRVPFWREKDIPSVHQPYPLQYFSVRKQGPTLP
jgi:hypothetical protein